MNTWTRQDTRNWISQLERRMADIKYYLDQTLDWCEDNDICDDRYIFILSFMTCIWVCNMRSESIAYSEILDILGVKHSEIVEDKTYDLGSNFEGLDHEELLVAVLKSTDY